MFIFGGGIPCLEQRIEAHYALYLMGYMLFYISIPPDFRRNVSGYSTISLSPHCLPLPYSPSNSNSSTPVYSPPSSATRLALIPMISRAGCSHHRLDRRIPVFRSAAKHKSMIVRVVIYCAAVFWWQAIYIPQSPTVPPFS